MTGPTTPEQCPLCSQRLDEPSVNGLERHLPACIATESPKADPSPGAKAGKAGMRQPSKWFRKHGKR